MKKNTFNPLAATLVITAATAVVVAYCFYFPEQAMPTIIVYVSSIIFMSIILTLISWIYKRYGSSVGESEIVKITEDLNTEMIIWAT